MANGELFSASRLLLATGVSDDLPDIPGLRELWGKSVFTCPYCHGCEVRDMPLAVLGDGDAGYGYARLIQNWSRDLILVTGKNTTLNDEQLGDLHAREIRVVEANITGYENRNGKLSALRLSDGRRVARRAVFMRPPMSLRGNLPQQLGCTLTGDGLRVVVDEMGQTSVPGVYAAGDIVSLMHAVIVAAASGTKAAAMINHELIMEAPRPEVQETQHVR